MVRRENLLGMFDQIVRMRNRSKIVHQAGIREYAASRCTLVLPTRYVWGVENNSTSGNTRFIWESLWGNYGGGKTSTEERR